MINVRKLKLTIANEDEVVRKAQYQFIRDAQYAQNKALNRAMSFYVSEYYKAKQDTKSQEYKNAIKNFKFNLSNELFSDISFGKGVDTLSLVSQKAKKDFSSDLKNGLATGDRSARTYRRDVGLMTRTSIMNDPKRRGLIPFWENEEIFMKWCNDITFKVIVGRKDKDRIELLHTMNKIISGEYKLSQSIIYFDKKGDLMVALYFDIPLQKRESIKDRVLGVDLGIASPAYCSLSDAIFIRSKMGDKFELLKQRTQMKRRRTRTQQQSINSKGGKGKQRKIQPLLHLSECERKFADTYNHKIAKRIVDMAVKYQCEFINIENLTNEGFDDKLLANWSYYDLQQKIAYKAIREGIVTRKVNPYLTSQTCNCCGVANKENRLTQEVFLCHNAECKMYMKKTNADWNASINIARSIEIEKVYKDSGEWAEVKKKKTK